jgi:hypothetical protein
MPVVSELKFIVAGGMAVHIYTGDRITYDVDAEFHHKLLIPENIMVNFSFDGKKFNKLYFNYRYTTTLSLMHPDYIENSVPLDVGINNFNVSILSPIDLIVSKIARLQPVDISDISKLINKFNISSKELELHIEESLIYYPIQADFIKHNIRNVLEIAQDRTKNSKSDNIKLDG